MATSPKKRRQPARKSKDKSNYASKKTSTETRSKMHGLDFNLGYYIKDPKHHLLAGYSADNPEKQGLDGTYYHFTPPPSNLRGSHRRTHRSKSSKSGKKRKSRR